MSVRIVNALVSISALIVMDTWREKRVHPVYIAACHGALDAAALNLIKSHGLHAAKPYHTLLPPSQFDY